MSTLGFTSREEIRVTDWSMALDPPGQPGAGLGRVVQGLADVAQCIQIIVTTPLGTDPLRPRFGCDIFEFLDRPITTLRPHAVRAITDAIANWEKRAVVTSVLTEARDVSTVDITIEWKLNVVDDSGALPQRTIISLPLTT